MKPILFPADSTKFDTLGIGVLVDATSCLVTEERNGAFELELQYPLSGKHFSELRNRRIIYAEVDASQRREPFRIYRITKPMSGIVTVYAAHLSYDLSGIVLRPFSAADAPLAMQGIMDNSTTENPFSFETDLETTANFKVSVPSSVRSIMGGKEGSILDTYGGEYSYNHYTVTLHKSRGRNRSVTLRYGKNLVDLKQEENIQNVYTGVYPYWASETEYLELPERILYAEGNYGFERIRPLDASSEFDEKPTEAQLKSYALNYMVNNDIGLPKVSISVSFVPLEQSEEYKDIAPLQMVLLCDTVNVQFAKLGIYATAKCVKTVYDSLKGRYQTVELGEARTNIADTIANQNQAMVQTAQKAVDGLTSTEIFNKLTDHGRIQGIYIQDNKWYINAEVAKIVNLIADQVKSSAGKSTVQITGAVFEMLVDGQQRIGIFNDSSDTPTIRILAADGSNNGLQLTATTLNLGDIEMIAGEYPLAPLLYEDKEAGTALLHQLGANQLMTAKLLINGDGAGLYTADDGEVELRFDRIIPTGRGNCAWVYSSELQRNVLAQISEV